LTGDQKENQMFDPELESFKTSGDAGLVQMGAPGIPIR
jgi:hypothetical protein